MTGRMGHQYTIGPLERLPEVHRVCRSRAKAVLIKLGGRRRAIGQLMPRHMVGMSMRDEAPRLPAAHIDSQVDAGDSEAEVVVEQGRE